MGFVDIHESEICSRLCSSRVNQELRSLDPESQVMLHAHCRKSISDRNPRIKEHRGASVHALCSHLTHWSPILPCLGWHPIDRSRADDTGPFHFWPEKFLSVLRGFWEMMCLCWESDWTTFSPFWCQVILVWRKRGEWPVIRMAMR